MLDLETILSFCPQAVVLALVPGPDNIFVLTQSAVHGKGAGIATTLGLMTGVLVHTFAVALGVAAIFESSQSAFAALKYTGAGYLFYLAWKAFRAKGQVIDGGGVGRVKLRQLYGRGIIMNITNPKVSIFFLAFLPQFADPGRGSIFFQFVALGGLFILSASVVFLSIALAAGWLEERLVNSTRAQMIMHKIAGMVFVGIALKIATAHR